ncbi:hypothetical protein [Luteolibacter soli]|uniref:Uncharacterized protein n=1 Tax=Luteolibacter soli TaxID=3135280 RepID=A0ABU9B0J0_9BACT
MTSEFISKASQTCGVATVVLTVLAAVAGFGAWYFAAKEADWKDGELKRFQSESRERAALLEKEAAEARLELARIDPAKVPVRSVRVDIFVFATGPFLDDHLKEMPQSVLGSKLFLLSRSKTLCELQCVKFTPAISRSSDNTVKPPVVLEGWSFAMTFEWPSPSWDDADGRRLLNWLEERNASTADLDNEIEAVSLCMPCSRGEGGIYNGSCIMTLNGNIRRDFKFPSTYGADFIHCTSSGAPARFDKGQPPVVSGFIPLGR